MDDDDMLECLLNFPDMEDNVPHLLDFQALAIAQAQDAEVQHKLQMDPTRYMRRVFDTGMNLIVFASSPTSRWRMCIPSAKLDQMIHWYHMVLNHVGIVWRNNDNALLP